MRDEYPAVLEILRTEIAALEEAGLCEPGFIELRRGAGAYICGEESAMIESIEGKRGLPRHRPPYIAEVGLFGRPTLNHNVETLHWIRDIVENGPEWFAAQGNEGHPGPRSWMAHINLLLMLPALVLLVASQLPAGYIKRAVKHPMILGVKVWAFGHLLANGDLASLLLFGAFLGWAVWNRISVKRRGDPVYDNPAILYDGIAAVVGTVLYLWLILQGHLWLFGVPPVAMN